MLPALGFFTRSGFIGFRLGNWVFVPEIFTNLGIFTILINFRYFRPIFSIFINFLHLWKYSKTRKEHLLLPELEFSTSGAPTGGRPKKKENPRGGGGGERRQICGRGG